MKILTLQLSSCVTLNKLLDLPKPEFSSLPIKVALAPQWPHLHPLVVYQALTDRHWVGLGNIWEKLDTISFLR